MVFGVTREDSLFFGLLGWGCGGAGLIKQAATVSFASYKRSRDLHVSFLPFFFSSFLILISISVASVFSCASLLIVIDFFSSSPLSVLKVVLEYLYIYLLVCTSHALRFGRLRFQAERKAFERGRGDQWKEGSTAVRLLRR